MKSKLLSTIALSMILTFSGVAAKAADTASDTTTAAKTTVTADAAKCKTAKSVKEKKEWGCKLTTKEMKQLKTKSTSK